MSEVVSLNQYVDLCSKTKYLLIHVNVHIKPSLLLLAQVNANYDKQGKVSKFISLLFKDQKLAILIGVQICMRELYLQSFKPTNTLDTHVWVHH